MYIYISETQPRYGQSWVGVCFGVVVGHAVLWNRIRAAGSGANPLQTLGTGLFQQLLNKAHGKKAYAESQYFVC